MAIKLIKDPIHGNIEFSKFEEYFFYNPLINRLHNVLQNSMAYRVYPSAKTSRFAHSIGVMHLASQMFKYGLSNATIENAQRYLENKRDLLKKYILEHNVYPGLSQEQIKKLLANREHYEFLSRHLDEFFGSEFIAHATSSNPVLAQQKELFAVYLILQQALRIYGLTHDVGHLPLSHLSEFAIERLSTFITGNEPREIFIKKTISALQQSKAQIHETIGSNITIHIFDKVKDEIINSNIAQEKKFAHLILNHLVQKALEIMKKKNGGRLSSLAGIISGDIDADRLDFIMRDGLYSGIVYQTGDIDRVLKMYCLCKLNYVKGKKDSYAFLPAIQSLNDIQEILFDRFRIYKYMVNHHKVKKLDYAVQSSMELLIANEIKTLGNAYIENPPSLGTNKLIDMIKISKEVSSRNINFETDTHLFLQLTDSWLVSILNEKFIELLLSSSEFTPEQKKLSLLLGEIFTGSKNFISLWKRDQDFSNFIGQHSNLFFDKKMMGKGNDIRKTRKHSLKVTKELVGEFLNTTNTEIIRFYYLIRCIRESNKDWIQELQSELSKNNRMCLVALPKLKVGISNLQLVDLRNHKNIMPFKEISRTFKIIEYEIYNSLQFFVYYQNHSSVSTKQLENSIAQFIRNYFLNKLN